MIKKLVAEQAPVIFFSYFNAYVGIFLAVAIPLTDVIAKRKVTSVPILAAKIAILILLSLVFAQSSGKLWVQMSARDSIGALVILLWAHVFVNSREGG